MREKLLLALPIGWSMDVLPGADDGRDVHEHPGVHAHTGETGCVVGYRSYAAGSRRDVGRRVPSPGTSRSA